MQPQRNSTITGPWLDFTLIWGTPFLTWGFAGIIFLFFPKFPWVLILTIGSMGHHFPGFLRAFTNSVVFASEKTRILLGTAVLALTALYSYLQQSNLLEIAFILWGIWHGSMQAYGFARIYETKINPVPIDGRYLKSVLFLGFLNGMVWSDNRLLMLLQSVSTEVILIFSPFYLAILRYFFLVALCAATLLLFKELNKRKKTYWFPLLTSFISVIHWTACLTLFDDIVVGLCLFELTHDVQYLTLLWVYNAHRSYTNAPLSVVEKIFFGKGYWKLSLYLGGFVAYGSTAIFADGFTDDQLGIIRSFYLFSALLHFYLDGFIWKIRSQEFKSGLLGESLGLPARKLTIKALHFSPLEGVGIGAFVFLIFTSLFQRQASGSDSLTIYTKLAEIFPNNWYPHFIKGTLALNNGALDIAQKELQIAFRKKPLEPLIIFYLGDALYQSGEFTEAKKIYQKGFALDENDAESQLNLAEIFLKESKKDSTIHHLKAAEKADQMDVSGFSRMSWIYFSLGRIDDAKSILLKCASQFPNQTECNVMRDSLFVNK